MTVRCNSCGRAFEDYHALAVHISTSKGHKKGKTWAANYLLKNVVLKKEMPERNPLSDDEKEAKKSTVRELSGNFDTVTAYCPKCKRTHTTQVETEYSESPDAWKIQGKLAILCKNCGGRE